VLKGISVVTNFGDHLIRCENLGWLLSSLATLLVYIGQTLLPKQFLEAGKNLFVGAGVVTHPCFSQLQMLFVGTGNTPTPEHWLLEEGQALTHI